MLWSNTRWDPNKDLANQAKHGVTFSEAKTATLDLLVVIFEDLEHSTQQPRYIMVGMSSRMRLLVLVVAEIGPDTARIISARRPTRRERHVYENSER